MSKWEMALKGSPKIDINNADFKQWANGYNSALEEFGEKPIPLEKLLGRYRKIMRGDDSEEIGRFKETQRKISRYANPLMKREFVTTQKAFVKSLTRIKAHIEKEQIDEALEFIEKTIDVLSRMDDPELK